MKQKSLEHTGKWKLSVTLARRCRPNYRRRHSPCCVRGLTKHRVDL